MRLPAGRREHPLNSHMLINWEFGCGADLGQMCPLYSHCQTEVSLDFTDKETKALRGE